MILLSLYNHCAMEEKESNHIFSSNVHIFFFFLNWQLHYLKEQCFSFKNLFY